MGRVFSDLKPGLFAYKTAVHHEGLAALDWFDPDPLAHEMSVELWSAPLDPGWTAAQSFTFADGNAGLLFVGAAENSLALGRVRAAGDGVDILRRGEAPQATGAWDIIARINRADGTVPAMMGYDSSSGATWMIAPDPVGPDPLRLGGPAGLPAGWSHLHVIERADGLALFGRSDATGSAHLLAAVDGEEQFLQVWQEDWRAGERLVALLGAPASVVIIYEPATGGWELRGLGTGGGPGGSAFIAEGAWQPGFTVLLPFNAGDRAHVLGYDAETGAVEVLKIDGETGEAVWRAEWSEGWDITLPLAWGR